MTRKLRAGLFGLGMMGRNHFRVLQELDGVELAGVVDPMADAGVAGVIPLHRRPEELLARGIDLAVVATPTEDHFGLGMLLADAGVHTLIEKPLADTVEHATRLADAFKAAGLVGCVGHIERFNPAIQQVKARLRDGQAGEIIQIATRRIGPFPNRIRDVGVVKDLATHDIDLAAWIADSEYVSMTARTSHRTGRSHEDLVVMTGVLQEGTITSHLVNWLSPMKERSVTVTGTHGSFVADTLTGSLTWYANADVPSDWEALSVLKGVAEGDMVRYAFPKPEPLKTELGAFRDAVLDRDDAISVVSMADGVRVVSVAQQALDSARIDLERV